MKPCNASIIKKIMKPQKIRYLLITFFFLFSSMWSDGAKQQDHHIRRWQGHLRMERQTTLQLHLQRHSVLPRQRIGQSTDSSKSRSCF